MAATKTDVAKLQSIMDDQSLSPNERVIAESLLDIDERLKNRHRTDQWLVRHVVKLCDAAGVEYDSLS